MPAPAVELQHLKTSKQYDGAKLITRYWFQWQNRKDLKNLTVRIELLDSAGEVLTNASVQLPKTRITGYSPTIGEAEQKPIYASPVWILVDDIVRDKPATDFCFYTVTGLFTKSQVAVGKMNGKVDDLSHAG